MQTVRGVRQVVEAGAFFPLVDGLLADAVTLRQDAGALAACGNFGTHRRRGARIFVQGDVHYDLPVERHEEESSRNKRRATNRGYLFSSM